jgi:hypothetical protein
MNVAVIENNIVINVIIAESLELAEQLTGAEVLDADLLGIGVGFFRENEVWFPIKPDPRFVWVEEAKSWVAPELVSVTPSLETIEKLLQDYSLNHSTE